MQSKLTTFVEDLIFYDYILFGSAFILFILFITLGLILRKKIALAIFFILLGFGILFATPTYVYTMMHEYLFKNTTTLTQQKRLEYTDAIVLKGSISNESKFNFNACTVTASVHKKSKNKYRNYILKFKPIKKMSILETNILRGETRHFKMIVEPFNYSRDYNITLGAFCK